MKGGAEIKYWENPVHFLSGSDFFMCVFPKVLINIMVMVGGGAKLALGGWRTPQKMKMKPRSAPYAHRFYISPPLNKILNTPLNNNKENKKKKKILGGEKSAPNNKRFIQLTYAEKLYLH